ncbi:MAG: tRNA epoxyqueuosine(34) reductase QueG [Bacteroidales bacterium]|nr:tRNA epoxyqueuosine(34) reductase QueG [Bacteroidales bacterium]MCF8388364.1 tRNA epoxyqueuosine(34) reductase QueG [Bacteroidales bacterium]MCF8397271.1 tRNA epoxyqueuosine(34) reductase QueG [Bacteroidales bacterium]
MHLQEKHPKATLSDFIKNWSEENGFLACGIARVHQPDVETERLKAWLKEGKHADMEYMERNLEKRCNPKKLVKNARSVISLLYNYYPVKQLPKDQHYKISKYAYGRDYHKVIKKKLKPLLQKLREESGTQHSRAFVDSAPVMDKVWAMKSGLGWIGKNTMLLNRKFGSFFFVGEVITDLELEYDDAEHKDLCGSCSRCMRACPTGALSKAYVIDARKCISYHTIENKSSDLPDALRSKFENWIFGCDICQDVCPWNRIAKPHQEKDFTPSETLVKMNKADWENLKQDDFEMLFEGSAVKRAKYSGLKRNIHFVQKH